MIRLAMLLASVGLSSCALLTSAADELSECARSDECGCEQHCGTAADGSRRCQDGCENDEDCASSGLDARCSQAFQVCDRPTGRCVDNCSSNEIRCGTECCFGIQPICLGSGATAKCCGSGFACGDTCCPGNSTFYACSGNTCVNR